MSATSLSSVLLVPAVSVSTLFVTQYALHIWQPIKCSNKEAPFKDLIPAAKAAGASAVLSQIFSEAICKMVLLCNVTLPFWANSVPTIGVILGTVVTMLFYKIFYPPEGFETASIFSVSLPVPEAFIGAMLSQIFSRTVREMVTLYPASGASSFFWNSPIVPPTFGVVGSGAVFAVYHLFGSWLMTRGAKAYTQTT